MVATANGDDAVGRRDLTQRFIRAPDGRVWSVKEMSIAAPGGEAHADLTLVFYNDDAMRRVRAFPANWRDLGDDELYHVSLQR